MQARETASKAGLKGDAWALASTESFRAAMESCKNDAVSEGGSTRSTGGVSPDVRRKGIAGSLATGNGRVLEGAPKEKDYRFIDVQDYFDAQIVRGADDEDALAKTIEKFSIKPADISVNPIGVLTVKGLEPESRPTSAGTVLPGSDDGGEGVRAFTKSASFKAPSATTTGAPETAPAD